MIGMAHACNSNIREAGPGGSQTPGNPVLHDQILSSCSPSMGKWSQERTIAKKAHAQLQREQNPANDTRWSQNK